MEGLDERGLEMGLWRWLDKRAHRESRIVTSLDLTQVEERGSRRWLVSQQRIFEALTTLMDNDIIDVVYGDGSSRLIVLVRPPAEKISEEDCSPPRAAGAGGVSLARSAGTNTDPSPCDARRYEVPDDSAKAGLGQESAQPARTYVRLARDVFPPLMRQHGVGVRMPQDDLAAFAKNLRDWHDKHEISYDTIRLMMEEFVRHPEWCRRSRGAPWKVFLSRRSQILSLLDAQRGFDPSNRRHQKTEGYWRQRHTSRAISPA